MRRKLAIIVMVLGILSVAAGGVYIGLGVQRKQLSGHTITFTESDVRFNFCPDS